MRQVRGTVNSVELIGWIGDAPEQRVFSSGAKVCTFNVATKHWGARTDAGDRTVETDWTPVEAWEKLSEQCMRSLHKGSRVRVVGSLRTQSWDDKESGQRRYKTFVRADEVLFLDNRSEGNGQEMPEATEETEEVPF
ncbi:MAG: single-stranded DNA-binding protein [Chloroflexi bacterium]|nr:single-stranded DNA-binding protein [Chloroflexota bacterium]